MPTPRGMRDLPPPVMLLRKKIISTAEKVFERFGFDPMETPILELWESISGKYGDEAENKLMYWFEDPWGGKRYALRYDLTVPLARFISDHPNVSLPFKRYHIGRVYRHDEPQRGRYREFWQCDVDTVGSPYPEAGAEVLKAISTAIDRIGLPGYTIRLNDRRILRGIFEEKLGIRNVVEVYRAIDRLDKVSWSEVEKELKQVVPAGKVEKIRELLDFRGSFDEVLDRINSLYGDVPVVKEAINHLLELRDFAGRIPVRMDLSLVRGLDYYTGPIFEVVVKEPRMGSVAGGGRYDGLIGKLSGRDLPAVGGSIGIERIIDAGLELGVFKLDRKTGTQVFVASINAPGYAMRVADSLRRDFNVRTDLLRRNWKKQIEHARKLGIPVVVLAGKREEENGTVVLIHEGERKEVRLLELSREIRTLLKG